LTLSRRRGPRNASSSAWVQTGFTEELLFRVLIAGSLFRHLPFWWANLVQALIFFLPHLLILFFAPEFWVLLPLVFVAALGFGWIRIKSGSVVPSWIIHAAGNVTSALNVAIRTGA
jgi:membrane protease YdiL (CAAX protease family)